MIKIHASSNAIPKLDKKKYEGKFLKGDYVATLVDILREAHGNDYAVVAKILDKEASLRAQTKKGFGS